MKVSSINNQRIVSISFIRGVAALLVLFSHWGCNFFRINEEIAKLGYYRPLEFNSIPPYARLAIRLYEFHIDTGMMGVALFFLISGFLMVGSLKKQKNWKLLLINRLIRIYPLYAVSLAITSMILFSSAKANEIDFLITPVLFLQNLSLFRLLFWVPGIDGVIWTLELEMYFYLVVVLIKFLKRDIYDARIILLLESFSFVFVLLTHGLCNWLSVENFTLFTIVYTANHFLSFLPFILLGVVLGSSYNQIINIKKTLLYGGVSFAVFIINIYLFYRTLFFSYLLSYSIALTIFVFVVFGKWISGFHGVIIDTICSFSKISFPFYAIHGAAGYAVLAFLYSHWGNIYFSTLICFGVFCILSIGLHIAIEIPITKASKRILT